MEEIMEITTARSIHPLTAIAAVSVTLFSLAGIGAMTGLIPTSHGQTPQVQVVKAEEPAIPSAVAPATATAQPAFAEKIAVHKSAPKSVRSTQAAKPAEEPVKVVKYEAPVQMAQNDPSPKYDTAQRNDPAPRTEPAKPACYDCGVIEAVREIEKPGNASGAGVVGGGLLGGLLGHQTGAGRGRDVMTVLGAVGGAVAGNVIEKQVKKAKSYEITIRFDDGSSQLIKQEAQPAWHSGDRVKLVNGVITSNG
jgi:outer membrane lipoprotein SlyB